MDRTDLRLTFAGLGLRFIDVPRFAGSDLPDLYAALCRHHALETFEMHGSEGADIATEGVWEIHLTRNTLMIEEHAQRGFDLIKKEFADIAGTVKEHLPIPVYFVPRIELRALWPAGHDVIEAVRAKTVTISDDQFALLEGVAVSSLGLKFRGMQGDEDDHFDLEVGPYWSDPSQISLTMLSVRHLELETADVIEERLDETYDYFTGHVARFVGTLVG